MHSVITKARSKLLVIFLFFVLLPGCAGEKRYKILSVFFDGVPKPGTKKEQKQDNVKPGESPGEQASPDERKTVIRILSKHPDYENQNCDKCHDRSSSNFLRARSDRICFLCHDEGDFKGAFVHGPAAVSDCLTCHFPHESQFDKLLIADTRKICLYCHQAEDVALNPVHARLFPGVVDDPQEQPELCTPCHDPHKGDNRFFIKKGVALPGQKSTGK
jgi:predicted CXXCH cytochrome family protein